MNTPTERMSDPCVVFWMARKGYALLPPCWHWGFWRIAKKDGVTHPFNENEIIEEYLADPLSLDDVAINHRQANVAVLTHPAVLP